MTSSIFGVWICKECGHKNNNSNLKCHGVKCKAERITSAVEQPPQVKKLKEVEKVYDACPKCHKDTIWIATRFKGKKAWRCTSCQRTAILIGKPKPFPVEVESLKI